MKIGKDGIIVDGVFLDNSRRQPCEIWTRVMGYHRPVSSFNTGKKGEFNERVYFREDDAHGSAAIAGDDLKLATA